MKKFIKIISVLLTASFLTACGDTSQIDSVLNTQSDNSVSASTSAEGEIPQTTELPEIKIRTDEEAENDDGLALAYSTEGYDVDLTQLDGNMIFAQVYDMTYNPESYLGKKILVKGQFSYFQDNASQAEYFAAYIPDAAGCCGQGIEFVLDGDYTYPQDYPELGEEIYVTGTFNSYQEYGATYCQLLDAEFVEM